MASYGTLLAQVFTSRAQIPIQGATVAATQRAAAGRHTLLAVRTTGSNGRIAPITLPTPDPAASESPGTAEPFAVCDLWAEAPGYELLYVENVQVFPGTETIQTLELIPLPEETHSTFPLEWVDIPAQDL